MKWMIAATTFFTASLGFADCKDLIMKIKDPKGGENAREITSFMNCHSGSYYYPGATTVHLFEWKNRGGRRMLCQSTRTCGNAKLWRGSFSVGAVWTMGNYVTDIINNTDFKNNFTQLSEGQAAGNGGNGGNVEDTTVNAFVRDQSNNLCVNTNHNSVKTFGIGGDVTSGDVKCYSKNSLNVSEWQKWEQDLQSAGYSSPSSTDIASGQIAVVCKAGDGGPGLGDSTGNNNIPAIQDCRGSGVNVNGGAGGSGGNAAAPSFGLASGNTSTTGTTDTDSNELRVHLNYTQTYENIKRYCADPQDEWCY